MTVKNAIDEFLIEQQIRGNSKATVLYYSRCLGFFADFNGLSVRSIGSVTLSDCRAYSFTPQRAQHSHNNATDIYSSLTGFSFVVLYGGLYIREHNRKIQTAESPAKKD